MGLVLVLVSERELNRIEVLSRIADGSLSVTGAAALLALSPRQVHRLARAFRQDGALSVRHKARGPIPAPVIKASIAHPLTDRDIEPFRRASTGQIVL